MPHRKCMICLRRTGKEHCGLHDKPCASVQDDGLFDPCGVSTRGPWEVPRQKERKIRRKNNEEG